MKSVFSMLSSLNIHKLNFCRPASVTNDHVDFESPNITASKVHDIIKWCRKSRTYIL